MALQLTIGGTDYTPYARLEGYRVQSTLAGGAADSLSAVLDLPQGVPIPLGGQEIILTNGGVREFAGVVLQVTESSPYGRNDLLRYEVQASDYQFWLNKYLVAKIYPAGTTLDAVVRDIVANYCPGFTTNNVQAGPALEADQRFDYVRPSDAIKRLADMAQYGWYVDYQKDVHFYGWQAGPASPLPGNTLLPDTQTVDPSTGLGIYGDLEITEDVSQLRNRVVLHGHSVASTTARTDAFVADGQQTSFQLAYEPIHQTSQITVLVGGVRYPVYRDVLDGSPSATNQDGRAYVNWDSWTIRFNVAPASGTLVTVTYYPRLPTAAQRDDPVGQQIMARREGGDGVHSYAINDPKMSGDNANVALARGRLELVKFGRPHLSGQFTSFLPGWHVGQQFTLQSSYRRGGMKQQFFVVRLTKTVRTPSTTPIIETQVEFSDSPFVF